MAAAGSVNVVISATDRVTAKVDAINKRLAAMRAPTERLTKSLERFGKLTGLANVGEGFRKIGGFAKDAFLQVSRVVTPLAAITGAASLAGMYRLTESWANFGSHLGFAAQRIGLSSNQLQSFDGAARLAGSSADSMQSGLQTLGQNMWDAVGGRNPAFFAAMSRLHISWQRQNGSAKGVAEVLPQIADRIKALRDPYAQAAVATELLGSAGEDLLPVLRLGSTGLAAYQRQAVAYGVINGRGVAAANRLRMAQMSLQLAVEGLGYSVAEKLEPVLSPLLQSMAAWIARNRDWIATKIGTYVGDLARWLKSIDWNAVQQGVKRVWGEFATAVTWLGGMKAAGEDALAAIAGLYAAKVLFGLGRLVLAIKGVTAASRAARAAAAAAEAAQAAAGAGGTAAAGGIGPARLGLLGLAGGAAAAGLDFAYQRGAGEIPGEAWGALMAATRLNKLDQDVQTNIARHQAPLRPEQFSSVAREDIADWMRRGYTRTQADILEGNLAQESGLNPYAMNKTSGAFGLAQWLGDRVQRFKEVEGVPLPYATRAQQRDFVAWELNHTEASSGRLLRSLTSADQAAAFGQSYERYGAGEEGNRTAYSEGFGDLQLTTSTPAPPPLSAKVPAPAPGLVSPPPAVPSLVAVSPPAAVPAPVSGRNADFERLLLELHVHGAAPGTSVGAKSRSPALQVADVKVHRAMASDVASHGV